MKGNAGANANANGRQDDGLMKISTLAAAAGVSKQTIHYYLREGILAPPVKNSRNMAYYGPQHVDELRLIKDLQEKRYLPLAVIKKTLEDRRRGGDMHNPDHLDLMQRLFAPYNEPSEKSMDAWTSSEVLLKDCGLTSETLAAITARGLITPREGQAGPEFNALDTALVGKIAVLMEMGFHQEDLELYSRLLKLMSDEINLAHDRIIHNPAHEAHLSLADIEKALTEIKDLIMVRAYREFFISHSPASIGKGGLQDD